MNLYHIPENEQKMDEIYVVLSVDDKGEGICSMMTPQGGMPLVFGHARMLDHIRQIVKGMAKDTGKKIVIAKFTKAEILEEF